MEKRIGVNTLISAVDLLWQVSVKTEKMTTQSWKLGSLSSFKSKPTGS